jgi:SSS family solute:Na+ symporter
LIIALIFAMCASNVISAYTLMVTFNTFFGAAVFLTIFWRRLTAVSILIGTAVWVVVMGLIPLILPSVPAFRQSPSLLAETYEYTTTVTQGATALDVAAGSAQRIGQPISKPLVVLPTAVYFDKVARQDPRDPASPLEGLGRFNVENYYAQPPPHSRAPFHTPALMTTARWAFDGLFPFVILIVLSFLTKRARTSAQRSFLRQNANTHRPHSRTGSQEVQLSLPTHTASIKKRFCPAQTGNSPNGLQKITSASAAAGSSSA